MQNNKETFRIIIKDASKITASRMVAIPIGLIVAFINAKLLGPDLLGIAAAVGIVLIYTEMADFGVLSGYNRAIPYLRGRGEKDRIQMIRTSVFYQLLFVGIIFSVGLATYTLFVEYKFIVKIGLLFTAASLFLQQLQRFFEVDLRTRLEFGTLASAQFLRQIFILILNIGLVLLFGLYGLWFASIFVAVLWSLIVIRKGNVLNCLRFTFHFQEIWELFKVGAPIFLIGSIFAIYSSIDRVFIVKYLGTKEVGLYAMALMVRRPLLVGLDAIGRVIYPRMTEQYGRKECIDSIREYILTPLPIISYSVPFFTGLLCIFLHILVEFFLPDYLEGVLPAQLYLIGIPFLALRYVNASFFLTTKRFFLYGNLLLFTLVVGIILNFIFLFYFKLGLSGVALGMAGANFFLGCSIMFSVTLIIFHSNFERIKYLIKVLLSPIINTIFIVIYIYSSNIKDLNNYESVYWRLSIFVILLILLNLPFILLFFRKFKYYK